MSTCFFIGHRDTPEWVSELLADAIERHIVQYGVTTFVVGYYGNFDHMAARAVSDAKRRHPEVSLVILKPYASRRLDLSGLDVNSTFHPPATDHVPPRFAIIEANRYMALHSEYLIAYVRAPGNSREIMALAQRQGKHVENLAGN